MQRSPVTGQLLGKIIDRVNQRAAVHFRFHVEKQVATEALEFRKISFRGVSLGHGPSFGLLMYLEKNFMIPPQDTSARSLAFNLLRTMRLSVRAVGKYGKQFRTASDETPVSNEPNP